MSKKNPQPTPAPKPDPPTEPEVPKDFPKHNIPTLSEILEREEKGE